MKPNYFLPLLSLFLFITAINAHPEFQACDVRVPDDNFVMNGKPTFNAALSALFVKNGELMTCGDNFNETDVIKVRINAVKNGVLLEVSGAKFKNNNQGRSNGNCVTLNPRLYKDNSAGYNLNFVEDDTELVNKQNVISVYVANANGVNDRPSYSDTCTIIREGFVITDSPTESPTVFVPGNDNLGAGIVLPGFVGDLSTVEFVGLLVAIILAAGAILAVATNGTKLKAAVFGVSAESLQSQDQVGNVLRYG